MISTPSLLREPCLTGPSSVGDKFNELLHAAAEELAQSIQILRRRVVPPLVRDLGQSRPVDARHPRDLLQCESTAFAKLAIRDQFLQAKSNHVRVAYEQTRVKILFES